MSVFSTTNPFIKFLAKLADLVILNLLIVVFSLPIVTAGAAITAGHYATLKLHRGEGYVIKNYWKSFRLNFAQSTVIWISYAIYIVLSVGVIFVFSKQNTLLAGRVQGGVVGLVIISLFLFSWIIPLQARFTNQIRVTVRNAIRFAFKYFLITILMVIISLSPIVIALFINIHFYTILFLFGASAPIYLCVKLYDKVFKAIEDNIF